MTIYHKFKLNGFLICIMEFTLIPVKEKPRKMGSWGKKRFKKRDKYDFKGEYEVSPF